MSVEIVPLKPDHMSELAAGLRLIDRLEVACMAPDRPVEDVLLESERVSLRGRAGFIDGDLVACWGVSARTPLSREGSPWLLATQALDRPDARRAFVQHSREQHALLVDGFQNLWNLVHAQNRVAIRWLKFLGFEFPGQEYQVQGEPFSLFRMEV